MRLLLVLMLAVFSLSYANADGLKDLAISEIAGLSWKDFIAKLKDTNLATVSHEQAVAIVAKAEKIAKDPDTTIATLADLQTTLKSKASGLDDAVKSAAPGEEKRNYVAAVDSLKKMNDALEKVVKDTDTLDKELAKVTDWKKGDALVFQLGTVLNDNARTDNMIKKLAENLDKTVVGQYMRTKLEGFSSSKEFCASVKNCTDGKANPKKPIEMKGLFKGDGTHDGTQPAPK